MRACASAHTATHLVACNLAFSVVLKVAVALDAALDELAELCGKLLLIVEVVHAQTRARSLGRVRRSDALLGSADAACVVGSV